MGKDGAALLTLWHKTWSPWELTRLWSGLGWSVSGAAEHLPVDLARTRFPGIRLPVGFTNAGRTAMLVTIGVFGYAGVWVAVMVIITG